MFAYLKYVTDAFTPGVSIVALLSLSKESISKENALDKNDKNNLNLYIVRVERIINTV